MRDMRRQESSKSAGLRPSEQVKKVFWTVFIGMAGLVLARVVDPVTAQAVLGAIAGMGG